MKKLTIAGAALSAAALLAGCGDEGTGQETMPGMSATGAPAAAQAEANQADITFAQEMIPHHKQAIDMATLVADRATSQEVIELATQIEQAQDPEVQTMKQWLDQWGADEQMQHGGGHGGMTGMMSDEDMKRLHDAKGGIFDRMWLRMMIEHHEGAIEMARTELENGSHPAAKEMAQEIIDAQRAEIDTMRKLLRQS